MHRWALSSSKPVVLGATENGLLTLHTYLQISRVNTRMYNRRMPRPCKLDTVQFRRKLLAPERDILLVAGQGDLTQGFHFLLELYAHLHAQGLRPHRPLESVMLCNYQNDPGDS